MKTEEFDDAIRGKLEGINQKFDEQEVDKVFNYVRKNFRLPFWDTYGTKIIYASGIAAVVGLIIWNINQHLENRDLKQTVATLQNEMVQIQAPAVKTNTDTVFITKYVYQNSNRSIVPVSPQNIENTKERESQVSKNENVTAIMGNRDLPINDVPVSPEFKQNDSISQIFNSDPKPDLAVNYASISSKNEEVGNNPEAAPNNSLTDSVGVIKGNDSSNVQSFSIVKPDTIISAPDTIKPKHTKPQKSVLSETAKQIEKAVSGVKISLQNNPAPNNISLRYLNYRGGIGVEKGNGGQVGVSLIGELLWSKRWSISTGFKMLNVNNEKYNDDDEFHMHKGEFFRQLYLNQVNDTSSIKNIRIRNMILQVPVAINYHLRFNNNYALLLSVGTDFDLYAKQHINFEHHQDIVQPQTTNLNTKYPVVAFNNLVISAGVQKQWKHFVFQFKPYISPQLKSIVYKKEDVYFGLRLNVLMTTE